MPRNKPLYIAFEGGDGGGKSTQAHLLKDALGENAVFTFEPGGTDLGVDLRRILLDPTIEELDPMTEAYLMAADRAHHMQKVVRPNLDNNNHVVADRTFVSSIAYQGAGRGLGVEEILNLNLMNKGLILPDLILIMAPPSRAELEKRLKAKPDKLESAGNDFHKRVAECFGQMAHILAGNSHTKDIDVITIQPESCGQPKSLEEVHREVIVEIEDFCSDRGLVSPV